MRRQQFEPKPIFPQNDLSTQHVVNCQRPCSLFKQIIHCCRRALAGFKQTAKGWDTETDCLYQCPNKAIGNLSEETWGPNFWTGRSNYSFAPLHEICQFSDAAAADPNFVKTKDQSITTQCNPKAPWTFANTVTSHKLGNSHRIFATNSQVSSRGKAMFSLHVRHLHWYTGLPEPFGVCLWPPIVDDHCCFQTSLVD